MVAEQILGAGILDIIFEGRNKGYGAYRLRKGYSMRMLISLVLSLGLSIPMVYFLCGWYPQKQSIRREYNVEGLLLAHVLPPKLPLPASSQPASDPNSNSAESKQKLYSSARLGSEIQIEKDLHLPHQFLPGKVFEGLETGRDASPAGALAAAEKINKGSGNHFSTPLSKADSINSDPVESPEVAPSFPGGEEALARFLKRNLVMPSVSEPGTEVRIIARFIVDMDGKVTSICTDGRGDEFDREVKRVLRKMPGWVPGKSKGRNVSSYFRLPVIFHNFGD